jgi:hypothetical protein
MFLFFQVRVSHVLRFISICVLFTDSPSYFKPERRHDTRQVSVRQNRRAVYYMLVWRTLHSVFPGLLTPPPLPSVLVLFDAGLTLKLWILRSLLRLLGWWIGSRKGMPTQHRNGGHTCTTKSRPGFEPAIRVFEYPSWHISFFKKVHYLRCHLKYQNA